MKHAIDVHDMILNYNPEEPQERFKAAGLEAALVTQASDRLPSSIPWPAGKAPTAAPLAHAPAESEDLTKFKGYDAVVVTWTSAEAAALAALFTPGYKTSDWYEYRHNVSTYIPLVTGGDAPFNDTQKDMARYYHSMGLYFPCKIGSTKVLVFKSGLHLDYDGPAIPVKKLMDEIATAVAPKVFITTGTGGGIGSQVKLGDVCIAGDVKFFSPSGPKYKDKEQFSDKAKFPWNAASFKPTPVPAKALAAITPALTQVNAAKVVPGGGLAVPKIWAAATDAIVTTDFFGFDDSTNYYGLQAPNQRVCDMGDAMVGYAMQAHPKVKWFAIRNASDPQMPDPNNDIKAADQAAGEIYTKYGAFTTAASVIATWAVINAVCD
jgi:Phosphorylase superfamily